MLATRPRHSCLVRSPSREILCVIGAEAWKLSVSLPVVRFGGYPTLKKWLGYRQANRRREHPLTLAEAHHFRSMIQRLAALLTLHQQLDQLYSAASVLSLTAEDLGLRA